MRRDETGFEFVGHLTEFVDVVDVESFSAQQMPEAIGSRLPDSVLARVPGELVGGLK
jgi:hypothetical protein